MRRIRDAIMQIKLLEDRMCGIPDPLTRVTRS